MTAAFWHQCIASQGSTLKATTVIFSSEVCSTFTAMSSRTLLSFEIDSISLYMVLKVVSPDSGNFHKTFLEPCKIKTALGLQPRYRSRYSG
jgi:hypothetical protein